MAIKIILDYILLTLPEIYLMSWLGLKYSSIKIINPITTFLLPLTIIRMLDLINIFIIKEIGFQTVVTVGVVFLGIAVTHILNSNIERFSLYRVISVSFIKTAVTVFVVQIISVTLLNLVFNIDTLTADGVMFYLSRYPMLIGYFSVIVYLDYKGVK